MCKKNKKCDCHKKEKDICCDSPELKLITAVSYQLIDITTKIADWENKREKIDFHKIKLVPQEYPSHVHNQGTIKSILQVILIKSDAVIFEFDFTGQTLESIETEQWKEFVKNKARKLVCKLWCLDENDYPAPKKPLDIEFVFRTCDSDLDIDKLIPKRYQCDPSSFIIDKPYVVKCHDGCDNKCDKSRQYCLKEEKNWCLTKRPIKVEHKKCQFIFEQTSEFKCTPINCDRIITVHEEPDDRCNKCPEIKKSRKKKPRCNCACLPVETKCGGCCAVYPFDHVAVQY